MAWIDVREPNTRHSKHGAPLLFRYDPERNLIEIQRRGQPVLIDLSLYQQAEGAGTTPAPNISILKVRRA